MTPPDTTDSKLLKGKLVEWHNLKGWGWIDAPPQRYFGHITKFRESGRRPCLGDEVGFVAEIDERGRPQATQICILNEASSLSPRHGIVLSILLVLPLAAGSRLPAPLWLPPSIMLITSWLAWHLYASDKRKAKKGHWRIKENTLHLISLLSGWPGAFLAQKYFRHKTAKTGFQCIFWSTILFYQFFSFDYFFQQKPSVWLFQQINTHLQEKWLPLTERLIEQGTGDQPRSLNHHR